MIKRFLVVLVAGLLFGIGNPVLAQTEDGCIQKGGLWDATASRCDFHAAIEIDIHYPLELADGRLMEETIDADLLDLQTEYLRNFAEYGLNYSVGQPWGLHVDYETFVFSPDVLTLKFTIADYTGGAHGNSYFKTFIFDLAGNRELTLAGLFQPGVDPLETLAPLVYDLALAQMGEMSTLEWIATGTAPLPENYQSYALTPDALGFFFPPYQLAAYAGGPQTISLPWSALADVLAPAFAPAG